MIASVKFTILATATALAISGCGGGGGGGSSNPATGGGGASLSGVAASGMPIVGTVQITDATGLQRSVNTDSAGRYSISLSGLTAPFVLLAEGTVGGRTVRYYAPAVTEDIGTNLVNITPLSDLMLANIAGNVAANCAASTACVAALTKAGIDTAKSNLAARLAPTLAALGLDAATDLLHISFTAGSHTGVDALLDVLNVTVDTATKIATIKNVVSGEVVTDDLVASGDNNTVLAAGSTDAYSIAVTVKARLAEMDAILASSDSTTTKAAKLEVFCTGDFLWHGNNCAAFAAGLAAGTGSVGFSSSLEQVARFDLAGVDSIDPAATLDDQHVGTVVGGDIRMGLLWRRNAGDGKLYLAGDQMTGRYGLWASHAIPDALFPNQFYSSVNIGIQPTDASGNLIADRVTVSGPGLSGSYDFVPDASGTWFRRDLVFGNDISEMEYNLAQINAAVSSKAEYTFTVKNGATVVATFKRTLTVAPLASSSLNGSMFPSISNFPPLSLCTSGGTWTPNYVRNGRTIVETKVTCGNIANVLSSVSVEDGEATVISVPATPTATWIEVRIGGIDDSTGRHFNWTNAN
jgi:hypothetical protein